jgi:hypothetical protein
MPACAVCRGAVGPGDGALRRPGGTEVFHVRCAPPDLLASALEEWNAISVKGIRYFLQKYHPPELQFRGAEGESLPPAPEGESIRNGELFLDLGRMIRVETETRARR